MLNWWCLVVIAHVSLTVLAGHPDSNDARHREQVIPERKWTIPKKLTSPFDTNTNIG